MHDLDGQAWRAILSRDRQPRWRDLLGHPDGAPYLSATGKAVSARAADYLDDFFGPEWLGAAMDPSSASGVRIPTLARSSPVFALRDPRGAFIELIRWWAALEVLESQPIDGFTRMRRDARRDIRAERLLHTLTQARLAAMGMYLGSRVTLEPDSSAGRADVLLQTGSTDLLIEVATVTPEAKLRQDTKATDLNMDFLRALEREHQVTWEGDVPGWLPSHELEAWRRDAANAAEEVARTGRTREMARNAEGNLTVRPGAPTEGTVLSGPTMNSDQGSRLLGKLRQKAQQTRDSGSAWVWVEDHGWLHPATPFRYGSLVEKIDSFADLVSGVLADNDHLAGIVVSNSRHELGSLPADATGETLNGSGLIRGLPIDHVRETIVVPRSPVPPDQTRTMVDLCAREPEWFGWALRQLVPGTDVRALLVQS